MFFDQRSRKSDEDLMLLVQQGDARAFTLLYQRYSAPLVRYFYRMLWKDQNRAQDFLQDLFMRIIEDPHRFDLKRSFRTWLYSVAHNMCKNEYRKEQIRGPRIDVVDHHDAVVVDMEDELGGDQFAQALDSLLAHCGDDDRHLYVLRCELEMSVRDVALVLDCPEGTVKSRWFHLKKKLAVQLQQYNPVKKKNYE